MLKKLQSIDNKWFFSNLPGYCKNLLLVFIKGDMLVLLPLILIIFSLALISLRLMILVLGSYIVVRYLGEMIYWLHQQFGERKYRPSDFGFKKLDNHAIYIIYQTIATAWIVFGATLIFWGLLYMK